VKEEALLLPEEAGGYPEDLAEAKFVISRLRGLMAGARAQQEERWAAMEKAVKEAEPYVRYDKILRSKAKAKREEARGQGDPSAGAGSGSSSAASAFRRAEEAELAARLDRDEARFEREEAAGEIARAAAATKGQVARASSEPGSSL
jgi:hypothetical protein